MPSSHASLLPEPPAQAVAVSLRLQTRIHSAIAAAGGWLPFARYMEFALYEPGLGYYSGGSAKLGAAGDFVTAPEVSSLFGQSLARQVSQMLDSGLTAIVEIGAGSGALAATLLESLAEAGRLPREYLILEVSADLRERQQERLARKVPHLEHLVKWIDAMPKGAHAVAIANEVLDAMPVHVVRRSSEGIEELGVSTGDDGCFERSYRPARGAVLAATQALELPADYETEVNLAAHAFVKSLGSRIEHGALVFIDYGFPATEYYHPQRSRGTLMCHYRHHAHDDPFILPGLQDITAHVDFTAVAEAGLAAGHAVLGYASQAQFLVNCGLTDILAKTSPADARAYAPLAAHAQTLLSPAEMGELFKVLVLGRGIDTPLLGFLRGDRSHTLRGSRDRI